MSINIGDKNKIKQSVIGNHNMKQSGKSDVEEIMIAVIATVIGGILLAIIQKAFHLQS